MPTKTPYRQRLTGANQTAQIFCQSSRLLALEKICPSTWIVQTPKSSWLDALRETKALSSFTAMDQANSSSSFKAPAYQLWKVQTKALPDSKNHLQLLSLLSAQQPVSAQYTSPILKKK